MERGMSLAFTPPTWALALLLRIPNQNGGYGNSVSSVVPSGSVLPLHPSPSAMRQLTAQWLAHMRDDPAIKSSHNESDVTSSKPRSHSILSRMRTWFTLVFSSTKSVTGKGEKRTGNIRRVLAIVDKPNSDLSNPTIEDNRGEDCKGIGSNVSPLYQSLYFSGVIAGKDVPSSCMTKCSSTAGWTEDMGSKGCVMPFFFVDDSGEGRGILEGLKKMHSSERDKSTGPLAWVPAIFSFTLISLNPLK